MKDEVQVAAGKEVAVDYVKDLQSTDFYQGLKGVQELVAKIPEKPDTPHSFTLNTTEEQVLEDAQWRIETFEKARHRPDSWLVQPPAMLTHEGAEQRFSATVVGSFILSFGVALPLMFAIGWFGLLVQVFGMVGGFIALEVLAAQDGRRYLRMRNRLPWMQKKVRLEARRIAGTNMLMDTQKKYDKVVRNRKKKLSRAQAALEPFERQLAVNNPGRRLVIDEDARAVKVVNDVEFDTMTAITEMATRGER